MRDFVDREGLEAFMRALGRASKADGRVYLTGGATAVLHGWRGQTIDIDLSMEPEQDALLRAIPRLKEDLHVNVELAAPSHFIPEVPGWRDRSQFIATERSTHFYHYDYYAQALSKLQRGEPKDLGDVAHMQGRGLIEMRELRKHYAAIRPHLYRYPALSVRDLDLALDAFEESLDRGFER